MKEICESFCTSQKVVQTLVYPLHALKIIFVQYKRSLARNVNNPSPQTCVFQKSEGYL